MGQPRKPAQRVEEEGPEERARTHPCKLSWVLVFMACRNGERPSTFHFSRQRSYPNNVREICLTQSQNHQWAVPSNLAPSSQSNFIPTSTSFHILFSIVFEHLLFHHYIPLYPTYERDYFVVASLFLTNFIQHKTLQVPPWNSKLNDFIFLVAEQYSSVYMYHSFIIHSFLYMWFVFRIWRLWIVLQGNWDRGYIDGGECSTWGGRRC